MPTLKHPAKTDISVLILFFNRPEMLRKTFASIKAARPSRIFLYQDGARNEEDVPRMEECRKIVDDIDWECEVHKNYQTENAGCDPSNFNAQRWAFSLTDKCAIFEDDDIISESLLPFFKEMLDRYENDNRIAMIQGFNCEGITPDVDSDYFFTTNFSIWGWASWRRVIDKWEKHYDFMDKGQVVRELKAIVKERNLRKDFLPMCYAHKNSGKAYYESIFYSYLLLNSQLAIVPTRNMLNNIGISEDSTHFEGGISALPKGYRRIFTMPRYELDINHLKHPEYVMEHVIHRHSVYRIQAWNHPLIKMSRSIEELFINLRHGNFSRITSGLKNRLNIIFKGRKFK